MTSINVKAIVSLLSAMKKSRYMYTEKKYYIDNEDTCLTYKNFLKLVHW